MAGGVGERPNFIHHQPHREQTATSRGSREPFGRSGEVYGRSEEEYRRFHESYVRSLEMTHSGLPNLPHPEDRDLEDMTEQDIDAVVSQMEQEAELFHAQRKSRP